MIEKKLSDWARENGMNYRKAWHSAKAGTLPVKTTTNANGRIFALLDDPAPIAATKEKKSFEFATPALVGKDMSVASTRRNAAATSTPTDEYFHINNGITPSAGLNRRGDAGNANFSVSETISLCQKAYFNFSIFRNTIDAMTEFSVSKMYFQGGNSKSRNFFENYCESLGITIFQDQFFREYYRSGNVIVYRNDAIMKDDNIERLNKVYGSNATKLKLPVKYTILNPCDVGAQANIVFGSNTVFFKRLNGYEIHRLKNPETPEEKNFFDSLPQPSKDQIKAGGSSIIVPLDPTKVYAVFYKKQDYEVMSIPMGYPVLKDIEWKAEMKHIDMAVSRTMNNAILLVKMGYESKDGEYMFDAKAAINMQKLFESESVGKTLVADFTTEVSFVIPAIGDFLDPEKYEIVNEDIKTGLNYVLTGTDSKFANQFISVQLFVQRLEQAREIFLNQFLVPEIKRISGLMGFKNYPTPKFHDIDLKDDVEFTKVATRMTELGLLTAPELFDAIETGRVPTSEESLEHQEEYRALKDKGFYDPLIGGPYDAEKLAKLTAKLAPTPAPGSSQVNTGKPKGISSPNGRPTGLNVKQTTKKIGISKGSEDDSENEEEFNTEQYSLSKIKEGLILSSKLRKEVQKFLCHSSKTEVLSAEQIAISEEISEIIIANTEPNLWISSIEKYVKSPVNDNKERLKEIDKIAYRHGIEYNLAAILLDGIK